MTEVAAVLAPSEVSEAPEARLARHARQWAPRPSLFVREALHAVPDVWQDEALAALAEGLETGDMKRLKLALKACKGPGKTCLLAWIVLWFIVCYKFAKILVTSITFENLKDGLWAEIALWINKSALLRVLLVQDAERLYVKGYKDLWFCSARTWPKDADKAKQADTLAGLHAKNTMILLDEAGGIPVGVLVAALAHHSTQAPGEREVHITVMAGNPTTLSGALGWACTADAANWTVKEITGDPDDPARAKRIDINWAREMIEKFGRDSPFVLVNVFGMFPPVGIDKLLGPDEVRAAMRLALEEQAWRLHPKVMALDVARSTGRDRSVLARAQGGVVFPFRVYRLDDAVQLAGQVAFEFARWPAQMVVVDAVGLGGPVADHLRAIGLPVVMFEGGLPARDKRFVDRRTETWWNAAQMIKDKKMALPNEPELVADLTEPMVEFTVKGQLRLESKERMLKRGISSPDMGDALTMLLAEPTFAMTSLPKSTVEAITTRGGQFTRHEESEEQYGP